YSRPFPGSSSAKSSRGRPHQLAGSVSTRNLRPRRPPVRSGSPFVRPSRLRPYWPVSFPGSQTPFGNPLRETLFRVLPGLVPYLLVLVPKLRLGTHSAKLCFAPWTTRFHRRRETEFPAACVPKRSLGTR